MASAKALRLSRHYATSGKVFEHGYVKTGTFSPTIWGMGVMGTLDGDAVVQEYYRAPPEIPGATSPKLQILLLADAITGVARIEPAWRAVNADVDITSVALSTEGLTPTARTGGGAGDTMQWESGDAARALLASWTMDATTAPAANQLILVTWTFRTASWSLAVPLCGLSDILWEA